ncbi:hypothetical protein [Stutzerimonas stutzeri]|uniref:hypothetical protein n=1 Tax=Stutzerimonas stutzeri TaxID=316 RepID=UPI00265CDB4B|nr:hypothetical protein [Stutzerimonas stutzeri]MCF6783704.1 hypothetical protein [Stutzerimonas stutzeri]
MGEYADQSVRGFERGKTGSHSVPRIYPKASAWQLINRSFFISTIDGSDQKHICCDAPGDFSYILRSKVRAVPKRKVRYEEEVESLSDACSYLGLESVKIQLSNTAELIGRLISYDYDFAAGFLERNASVLISGESLLLDEVARLVVGVKDSKLSSSSDLLKHLRRAGPLSDADFDLLRRGLGGWKSNQATLAATACLAEWRKAGFLVGNVKRTGVFMASCIHRGTLFSLCNANEAQPMPQLFSSMKVCIGDSMAEVRHAGCVNDAWQVMDRWAREIISMGSSKKSSLRLG